MKPSQRRAANQYPYFKLATWDGISMTFRDGRKAYATERDAQSAAKTGKNRVSVVKETGREDLEPFMV